MEESRESVLSRIENACASIGPALEMKQSIESALSRIENFCASISPSLEMEESIEPALSNASTSISPSLEMKESIEYVLSSIENCTSMSPSLEMEESIDSVLSRIENFCTSLNNDWDRLNAKFDCMDRKLDLLTENLNSTIGNPMWLRHMGSKTLTNQQPGQQPGQQPISVNQASLAVNPTNSATININVSPKLVSPSQSPKMSAKTTSPRLTSPPSTKDVSSNKSTKSSSSPTLQVDQEMDIQRPTKDSSDPKDISLSNNDPEESKLSTPKKKRCRRDRSYKPSNHPQTSRQAANSLSPE